jgi:hypothetical protein
MDKGEGVGAQASTQASQQTGVRAVGELGAKQRSFEIGQLNSPLSNGDQNFFAGSREKAAADLLNIATAKDGPKTGIDAALQSLANGELDKPAQENVAVEEVMQPDVNPVQKPDVTKPKVLQEPEALRNRNYEQQIREQQRKIEELLEKMKTLRIEVAEKTQEIQRAQKIVVFTVDQTQAKNQNIQKLEGERNEKVHELGKVIDIFTGESAPNLPTAA